MSSARASALAFEELRPDAKGNWLNLTSNDFDELMPLIDKDAKASARPSGEKAIFKLYGNGINTARDEWVTDFDASLLSDKVRFFLAEYAKFGASSSDLGTTIKWSRNLKTKLSRGSIESFDAVQLCRYAYRPFLPQFGYLSPLLIDELGRWPSFDGPGNRSINFPAAKGFYALASDLPTDFHFAGDTKTASQFRYDEAGTRIDNITDWSLAQFQKHYQPGPGKKPRPITKEAIFHYVYAVLHDPQYREKYAQNLKREFPRIPLYGDSDAAFWQWAGWGAELMRAHIGYESVEPFALVRTDVPDEKARAAGQSPKPALKADKDAGRIVVDSETTLTGIPAAAWRYQLGNRCALDWVLDQHKEKKPKDPTIRERFDSYRLEDHKEHLIELLMRVTTVSVETVRIVDAIKDGGGR